MLLLNLKDLHKNKIKRKENFKKGRKVAVTKHSDKIIT